MQQLKHHLVTPSLKEVGEKFEHWRATRIKRGRIPEDLWQHVITLTNKYPIGEICKTLGLNGSELKAKMKAQPLNPQISPFSKSNKIPDFVEIKIAQPLEKNDTEFTGKVEIKRADGAAIFIERLSQQTLAHILTQFMQGLKC